MIKTFIKKSLDGSKTTPKRNIERSIKSINENYTKRSEVKKSIASLIESHKLILQRVNVINSVRRSNQRFYSLIHCIYVTNVTHTNVERNSDLKRVNTIFEFKKKKNNFVLKISNERATKKCETKY